MTTAQRSGFAPLFVARIPHLASAIKRQWRIRQAVAALAAADDATLRDLGIARSSIENIVCGGRR
jgi:uncharacterized protein YjiS (DUF1127 family)